MNKNYLFSLILWITHFFNDFVAAFSLILLFTNNSYQQAFSYFMLYNILAFLWQGIIWHFLDKIKESYKLFKVSKKLVITSIIFNLFWLFLIILSLEKFLNIYPNFSIYIWIILIWIASAIFHVSSWTISLLSNKNKATNFSIFECRGVIWLFFWGIIALYFYKFYLILFFILPAIAIIIYKYNNFKIKNKNLQDTTVFPKNKHIIPVIAFLLLLILTIRSAIRTNYQINYSDNQITILFLAIASFLWKLIWGIIKDSFFRKDIYLLIISVLWFTLIFIYSYFYPNFIILRIWIFLLTLLLIPTTIILSQLLQKKAFVVSLTLWITLFLWYILYSI